MTLRAQLAKMGLKKNIVSFFFFLLVFDNCKPKPLGLSSASRLLGALLGRLHGFQLHEFSGKAWDSYPELSWKFRRGFASHQTVTLELMAQ